jgi:hypothetical protein
MTASTLGLISFVSFIIFVISVNVAAKTEDFACLFACLIWVGCLCVSMTAGLMALCIHFDPDKATERHSQLQPISSVVMVIDTRAAV